MSTRLKLNVKNVIQGCHNLNDIILKRNDYRFFSGFTSLAGPRGIPHGPYSEPAYKTDIKPNTLIQSEAVFPRKLGDLFLKRVFSEIPVTGKWLDKIQTGPFCIPNSGSLKSSCSFGNQKNHDNPVAPKSHSYSDKDPVMPICLSSIIYPMLPILETPLCTAKTARLNSCRFYCASPCQPQPPKKKRTSRPCKLNPCGPRSMGHRPTPKCRPMPHKRPILHARHCGGCNPKICKPKFCGGGGKKKSGGGDPCAGVKEAPKHCYGSDKKGGGKKSGSGKHPICPK